MSTVRAAYHQERGELWAIKALFPEVASEERARRRFDQEGKVYERLTHPNIVTLHQRGERTDGVPYLALEYVRGHDLATYLANLGRFPPGDVLDMLEELARALDLAHSKRVIHRDVKPQNIILNPYGILKLLDFGIARLEATSGINTATGQVLATYSYAPPEQNQGKEVDPSADLYSLGALAWEMLAGRRFITGTSPPQIVLQQTMGPPPSILKEVPGLPESFDTVLQRLCMPYPEDRYQSAQELWNDLRVLRRELASSDHAPTFYGDEIHEKWLLARSAFKNGQFSLATSLAKFLIARKSDHAPARFLLAHLARKDDLREESQEHFRAAISLRPKELDYRLDFGLAQLGWGEFPSAIETFAEIQAQAPGHPAAGGLEHLSRQLHKEEKSRSRPKRRPPPEAPLWIEKPRGGPEPRVDTNPGTEALPAPGIVERGGEFGFQVSREDFQKFPLFDLERIQRLGRFLPGVGHWMAGETVIGALAIFGTFLLLTAGVALFLWNAQGTFQESLRVLGLFVAVYALIRAYDQIPKAALRRARELQLQGQITRIEGETLFANLDLARGTRVGQVFQVQRRDRRVVGEFHVTHVDGDGCRGNFQPFARPPNTPSLGDFLRLRGIS